MITRECFLNLSKDRQLYEIAKKAHERVGGSFTKNANCFTDQTIDNQLYDIIDYCGDPDARNYIARIENQDGQPLEEGVRNAYCKLVADLKETEIWPLITCCCILAGARTINGAIEPLIGADQLIINGPWPESDYNRKTGLYSDASNDKYINTQTQSDSHAAIWLSSFTRDSGDIETKTYIGFRPLTGAETSIARAFVQTIFRVASLSAVEAPPSSSVNLNFIGVSRINNTQLTFRVDGLNSTQANSSSAGPTGEMYVYALNGTPFQNVRIPKARIAFYSIGGTLSGTQLQQFDSIITSFLNTINTEIP
jgi:hypothetical protein